MVRRRNIGLVLCLVCFSTVVSAAPSPAPGEGVKVAAAAAKGKKKAGKARPKKTPKAPPSKPVDDPSTVEAKRLYQEGEQAFALGQHEKALEAYTAGYKVKPLSAFLFNIAQCQLNIGDVARLISNWERALVSYDQAIFFYRKYLTDSGDKLRQDSIEKTVAEIEQKKVEVETARQQAIENERAARLAAADVARQDQQEAEAWKAMADVEVENARQAAAEAEHANLAARKKDVPVYKRWWFWTLISAVVLSGGATATYLLVRDTGPDIPTGTLGPGVLDCRHLPCGF